MTEFYRARTDTKMTIAAERLAVIAAVTLPVTAVVLDGRHERDRQRLHPLGVLIILLAVMVVMSFLVLRWARRQGWW